MLRIQQEYLAAQTEAPQTQLEHLAVETGLDLVEVDRIEVHQDSQMDTQMD